VYIDVVCNQIVQALHTAAFQHCPMTADGVYKCYWDSEMDDLKDKSIETHNMWVACGRPTSGPVYQARCKARAQYRRGLRCKHKITEGRISNDLHELLLSKDCKGFWKTWKSKVNNRHVPTGIVDGCSSLDDIANIFASNFYNACCPNDTVRNDNMKLKFETSLKSYCPSSNVQLFTVELVDLCMRTMKIGKAAGYDGIETEHLRHAHPLLCVMLCMLFNSMLIHGKVPSLFGCGIIVPLLKNNNLDDSIASNYRGITLSSHISKLFEMCIMDTYSVYFTTSDLQMGFKKKIGCTHALSQAER